MFQGERQVFGVPRDILVNASLLPPEAETQGKATYIPITDWTYLRRFVNTAMGKDGGYYRTRHGNEGAEYDPNFQQIIMYGFVIKDNKLLTYKRGYANEEPRLDRSRVAIGVGGHMELDDTNFIRAFYREIAEELEFFMGGEQIPLGAEDNIDIKRFKQLVSLSPVGIIKDERDEVGRMHTGVAIRIEPRSPKVDISVRRDNGESAIPVVLVDPLELFSKAQSGQVSLEGWGDIVLRQEILPKITTVDNFQASGL